MLLSESYRADAEAASAMIAANLVIVVFRVCLIYYKCKKSIRRNSPPPRRFSIAAEQPELLEDLKEDNRFHPTIIGTLLLIFMFCVSAFVSNIDIIESISETMP